MTDSTGSADLSGPLLGSGTPLERATLEALYQLEHALRLEPVGDNRFRANNEPGRFGRIFGGQLLAQAISAACATVDDQLPHSLHAYFVRAGSSDEPLELAVERTRDGRSMSTRQVNVMQNGESILTAMVSFDANPAASEGAGTPPPPPAPDELPLLQHWAEQAPGDLHATARTWIDSPPPLEIRMGEAPTFLGGAQARSTRAHWIRAPRDIGARPALHMALLAYASDYLLLDMAFRNHPEPVTYSSFTGLSLDHTIWLHRPVRFDRWHLYTQEALSIGGHRALIRGTIVDASGHLVASTAQEVLVRPMPDRGNLLPN